MIEDQKTLEEVAKTAGKAIDLAQNFGSFISRCISGPLEQGIGIFEDKLKYTRWERQIRLMKKADEFMKSVGIDKPNCPIELKLAVPLLQAATLEENDYLQDLWAKLLVNSVNDKTGIKLTRSYIDILERLTPLEAKILEEIYSLPFEEIQHEGVITTYLPDKALIANEEDRNNLKLENEEVLLALANLTRLGCISPIYSLGGGEIFSSVNPTVLGKYFVEACTLKNDLEDQYNVKMVEYSSKRSGSDIMLSGELNNKLSKLNARTVGLEIDTTFNQALEMEQKDRFRVNDLRHYYEKIIKLLESNPSIKPPEFIFSIYIKLASLYLQFAFKDIQLYEKIKSYLDKALYIGKKNEFEEFDLVPAYKVYVELERICFDEGGNEIYFLNKIFEENNYDYPAGIELAAALDRRATEGDLEKEIQIIGTIVKIDLAEVKQRLTAFKDAGKFKNLINSSYRREFLNYLKP